MTKICNHCSIETAINQFSVDQSKKDGLSGLCRACSILKSKAYYLKNQELSKEKARIHHAENREEKLVKLKENYALNAELRKEQARTVYRANVASISKKKKVYRAANGDKVRASIAAWNKAHPEKSCAYTERRRARKLQAVPAWWSEFDGLFFDEAVDKARKLKLLTGLNWHIDHIVPLKSKQVCGLHWHGNAQLLPAHMNQSKSNTYWPDMATEHN